MSVSICPTLRIPTLDPGGVDQDFTGTYRPPIHTKQFFLPFSMPSLVHTFLLHVLSAKCPTPGP